MRFPTPPPLKPKRQRPVDKFLPPDPQVRRVYKLAIFYTQIFWAGLFGAVGCIAILILRAAWPVSLKTAFAVIFVWTVLGFYFGYVVGYLMLRAGLLAKVLRVNPKT